MGEGDEGVRETWERGTMYQCLRSNAKGDRVAPGAPSREGRKSRALGSLLRSRMFLGSCEHSYPRQRDAPVKGAAGPERPEVSIPVPGEYSLQPAGCFAAGWAGLAPLGFALPSLQVAEGDFNGQVFVKRLVTSL